MNLRTIILTQLARYRPKDPELDQQLADWFSDQRTQGKHLAFNLDLYWWIVINVSEGMFYLHTVYSEKELFERATNTILGIRNCIVVMDIMLLSTCC